MRKKIIINEFGASKRTLDTDIPGSVSVEKKCCPFSSS